jgi:uncharacterized membrane protein YgcG
MDKEPKFLGKLSMYVPAVTSFMHRASYIRVYRTAVPLPPATAFYIFSQHAYLLNVLRYTAQSWSGGGGGGGGRGGGGGGGGGGGRVGVGVGSI